MIPSDLHDPPDPQDYPPLTRHFLWADSPAAVARLVKRLGILCAVLFLLDLVIHRHAYVPGEGLWGFHAIAGFVAFTLIVLGAKALRGVIGRPEDYYGPDAVDGEEYPMAGTDRLTDSRIVAAERLHREDPAGDDVPGAHS